MYNLNKSKRLRASSVKQIKVVNRVLPVKRFRYFVVIWIIGLSKPLVVQVEISAVILTRSFELLITPQCNAINCEYQRRRADARAF